MEVETASLEEVTEVLRLLDAQPACPVTRIMLDNMAKYDAALPGVPCVILQTFSMNFPILFNYTCL